MAENVGEDREHTHEDIEYEVSNNVIPDRIESLSEHLLEIAERRIAEKGIRDGLSQPETRSAYWVPLADMILACIRKDSGSRVLFYGLIEKIISRQASYARANIYMETLRRALIVRDKSFRYGRFIPYVYVYDPYLTAEFLPTRDQFRRIILDLDMDPTIAEDSCHLCAHPGHLGTKLPIPHLLPSVGAMHIDSTDSYYRMGELGKVVGAIVQGTVVEPAPIESGESPSVEKYMQMIEWLKSSCMEAGVRLFIINLDFGVANTAAVIKYHSEVIRDATMNMHAPLNRDMVMRLFPFTYPNPSPTPPAWIERLSQFPDVVKSMTQPFTMYGKVGPMGVVLDYAIGNDKYRTDLSLPIA